MKLGLGRDWSEVKRFEKLDEKERSIVFYLENESDFIFFKPIIEKLTDHYGKDKQERMFGLWKMFFLICSELFGYKEGKEWFVAHYKLIKRDRL